MTEAELAKKKPEERSPKNKERKDPGFRTVGIRGSDRWVKWLEEAAAHGRVSMAAFIDRAVVTQAKADGFIKKPPERIP